MKIAIVGSGFSGLTVANILAGVCDIDVYSMFGYCGTTGAISKAFNDMFPDFARMESFSYHVKSICVGVFGEYIVKEYNDVIAYTLISPKTYLKYLKLRSEGRGVNFIDKSVTVKDVDKLSDEYDVVIGADGVLSNVRKYLSIQTAKGDNLHFGLQVNTDYSSKYDVYIEFVENVPKGYIWKFKIDKNRYRIGYGMPFYMINNANVGNILPSKQGVYGGYISTDKPLDKCVYGNIILIGDAGGFCCPATGGGIGWSILSGVMASVSILANDLDLFDELTHGMKKELKRRYRLKKIMFKLSRKELEEALKLLDMLDIELYNPLYGSKIARKMLTKNPKLLAKIVMKLL